MMIMFFMCFVFLRNKGAPPNRQLPATGNKQRFWRNERGEYRVNVLKCESVNVKYRAARCTYIRTLTHEHVNT